jgi:hypothetical protein
MTQQGTRKRWRFESHYAARSHKQPMQPHTIYNRKPNCGILIVPSEGARRCVPAVSIETNAPRTWFLPLRANDEMPSFITEHATEGGRGQETTRRIRDVPKQVYIVCADLDTHSNLINISQVKPPGPGHTLHCQAYNFRSSTSQSTWAGPVGSEAVTPV